MSSIQELVNEAVKSERQSKEQRHWYISRLGACPTGQYLERLGVAPDSPFDDRTLRVFHAGRVFEDWIVGLLTGAETQVPVESQELDISGYADLKIGDMVYEIKSKHSRAFWYMIDKGEGANRQHEIQLWTYLYLLDLPEGKLVYISKDDLTIAEFPVFRDDAVLKAETLQILDTLNTAWRTKTPPVPVSDPYLKDETGYLKDNKGNKKKDWRWWYCSWHKQCMQTINSSNPKKEEL